MMRLIDRYITVSDNKIYDEDGNPRIGEGDDLSVTNEDQPNKIS